MTGRIDPSTIPLRPDLSFEGALWEAGILRVAGIDEAGRGPLAGPVAAAAVILPPEQEVMEKLNGVTDSKQMTPEMRSEWAGIIQETSLAYAVALATSCEIDELGIVHATCLAAQRAVELLTISPEHLLLDYLLLREHPAPQTSLIKGDCRSLSIAAASVLAKTSRDAILCEMDLIYPGYGFAQNKGYGTPAHLRALDRLGPCEAHRKSFQPVKGKLAVSPA